MKKTTIFSSVDLYFGRGLASIVESLGQTLGHRSLLIADRNVSHNYSLSNLSIVPEKSRSAKEFLEDHLMKEGYGRDSALIALGGGTLTDLVGFLASTYMRGLPLILVPSTLLGMVDAAIGGKTSIDTHYGKNLIGSFYQPKAIVIDLDHLDSLPINELINGQSEILKMGLVYDASILRLTGDDQIYQSILAKVAVVTQDPKESGIRRILNFGHTVAHAIELCSHFSISHGEAVALGCVAESYLSKLMGLLNQSDFQSIMKLFPKFKWTCNRNDLLKCMQLDKKNAASKIRFVLINKIGEAALFDGQYCSEVPDGLIEEMCLWMESNYV
jgi:3-dehydroquinate synthase